MENNNIKPSHKNSNLNIGRIFWGLLLILVGGLLVIDNFAWANVNWSELWRLWPLLIIAAGLSILSIRSVVWKILSAVLAIFTLAAVAFVALSGNIGADAIGCHDIQIDKSGIHIVVE